MVGETQVARAAVQTLAYLHLFQYTPTETELWQLLWRTPAELAEVTREVHDPAMHRFSTVGAFVSLTSFAGEEPVTPRVRMTRYRIAELKLERARRAARRIGRLPWVEGVAVCNSLGYQNARAGSDIDFFIIVKPNALWLTRFIVAAAAQLLGVRPTPTHAADTFCFSFWVTTKQLNLSPLALVGGDPYLTFWIAQLTPLFGRGAIWQQFWEANAWVHEALPNAAGYSTVPHSFYASGRQTHSVGRFVAWLNQIVGVWQRHRFPSSMKMLSTNTEHAVVIRDDVLKFHTQDRRAYYRQAWRRHCEVLNVPQ